jgi:undecaprenyl-diphosphatase
VQGVAEFLPVSSSGHLILIQNWFGITEGVIFFSVMLHLGTLVPVVVVLWKEILSLFKKPFSKFGYLVLATIPAGIVGVIFSKVIDLDLIFESNIWLLGITFLLTAGEMLFSEFRSKKVSLSNGINTKTSLIMGCGQALGVLPGLSRSGTTITFGTIGKVNPNDNANFAFLMSIPIILAAVAFETLDGLTGGGFGTIDFLPLAFGVVTAMITGYASIKIMLRIIKKANYKWFSVYLIGISIATFITAFR